mmetsp:Transcript_3066/g.6504  ORF Transcript_3066/g.6504 Transcript_3066/m.6504 type:complete len:127 (-) Transcript_3066:859-1239(-)
MFMWCCMGPEQEQPVGTRTCRELQTVTLCGHNPPSRDPTALHRIVHMPAVALDRRTVIGTSNGWNVGAIKTQDVQLVSSLCVQIGFKAVDASYSRGRFVIFGVMSIQNPGIVPENSSINARNGAQR